MASEGVGSLVFDVSFEELVEKFGGFGVVLLEDADLGLSEEVSNALLIDNIFQRDVSHVINGLLKQEVDQRHVQIVVLLGAQALIHCLDLRPVDDLNFEFHSLSPEVLGEIVLGGQGSETPHVADLGDGQVLAAHFVIVGKLVLECKQQVSKLMLPILIKHLIQVHLSLTEVLPLNIQRSQHQSHLSVQFLLV